MKTKYVLFLTFVCVAASAFATHAYDVSHRPIPPRTAEVFPLLAGEESVCHDWSHTMVVRNLSPLPLRLEQSLEKEELIDQMGRFEIYDIAPFDSARVYAHSPYRVILASSGEWLGMFNNQR